MTASPTPRPPRLAECLVAYIGRRAVWREAELGDLREEHAAVAHERGRSVAAAWYWRQALGLAAEAAVARMRRAGRSVISFLSLGDRPLLTLLQEIRFAVRMQRRQKLVAGAVVLTMALGLGANAAAYQMLNVLVWKPFAFENIDRLTLISESAPTVSFPRESVSLANFLDWKRQADVFDRVAALDYFDVNFAGGDEPERLRGFKVSPEMLDALGVRPVLGRLLSDSDAAPGRDHVLVLGDSLWRRRFGGRTDIVGQTVRLDGDPYTVVGTAPPGFNFPDSADFWSPLPISTATAPSRSDRRLTVIGRLRPGRSMADAQTQMDVISARLRADYPADNAGYTAQVQTLTLGMTDQGMPEILTMIQAGALLVLLIGSANIANLLLARGFDRQREIAVRLAVGGSRLRLLRQLLVESAVLAAAAIPMSLAMAWVVLRSVRSALPAQIVGFVPGWTHLAVDGRLVLVTVIGAAGSALLFGLFPALQTSRPELAQTLREGGRSVAGSGSRQRMRRTFVIAQLALALPLLTAAGLVASGAVRFATGQQGYDPHGVLLLRATLGERSYADAETRRQFTERLIEEASRIPGVKIAATVNVAPANTGNASRPIEIEGRPPTDAAHRPDVMYRVVSTRYFDALAIPVLRGRGFTIDDRAGGEPVAIVSQSFADKFWPGENAIGRRVKAIDAADGPWMTVVGILGDVIDDWSWAERRNAPALYVPMTQRPSFSVTLVARTDGDPAQLASAARGALRTADPDLPPTIVTTLAQALHDRTIGLQTIGYLMGGLGALALVLAAVGIYSLMAYYVSQRRHEIGVRLALGATRRDVARLTIGQSGRMSAIGLCVGLALALASSRVVEGVLFGVVSLDPLLLGGLTLTLAATAIIATVAPARQAARIDPATALRGE